jgi:glycosyltransferase involved in cell wall biosynthesis
VRILHIDTGAGMRGGQRQVLLLMQALRELECNQRLLARAGSPLAREAALAGFATAPATLMRLLRESASYNLVHAHDARSHTLAALAARAPFVVSRRVAFPVRRSPASRWKYSRARRYLAVSRFVAGQLADAGISEDRVDVVYDSVAGVPALGEWHRSAPALALASADPMKGRDLVERGAHISGVPVRFSHDLPGDLADASMFVYISRSEGLGSAALAAMAQGVPVAASQVGGLPEIVQHECTGLLTSNDEVSIAHAMRRLLSEEGLAARLRAAAHAMVSARFTAATMANQTLAAYRRALAR